jgi:hypothetical protein
MLVSNLFVKHKRSDLRLAPATFIGLLSVFVILGQSKPLIGLVGIGVTVILAGVLVELNRERIWDTYRKSYKKVKGLKGLWVEPNRVYYNLNVYFLWPFVLFLGILCLYAAYVLA